MWGQGGYSTYISWDSTWKYWNRFTKSCTNMGRDPLPNFVRPERLSTWIFWEANDDSPLRSSSSCLDSVSKADNLEIISPIKWFFSTWMHIFLKMVANFQKPLPKLQWEGNPKHRARLCVSCVFCDFFRRIGFSCSVFARKIPSDMEVTPRY